MMNTFILLFQCQDKKGIVARVSDFILRNNGNIVCLDQYSTDPQNGDLFMRVEFVVGDNSVSGDSLKLALQPVADEFSARAEIHAKDKPIRMAIFASKPGHCLFNLLYLWGAGELKVEIPFVASNYEGHRDLVERYKIPFHFVAAGARDRKEDELLSLLKDADFLVLARYMLVLSAPFLKAYGRDIINIHHGFLPSFKGGDPYEQALAKGVKVIGATAHFVTEELDNGPIIAQEVDYVSHKDNLNSLISKGRHLENKALSDAVNSYLDYRIFRHGNKTIVF